MKTKDRLKNMAWLVAGLVVGALIVSWIENNKKTNNNNYKMKMAAKSPANQVDKQAAIMESEGFKY